MPLAPLDLVSAHAWERATFTTYALSLSFFEAIILDALIRGRARHALILADVHGIRASLSEQGAQRVGKDYNVEPVAVSSGYAFHPKISVLSDKDECHARGLRELDLQWLGRKHRGPRAPASQLCRRRDF